MTTDIDIHAIGSRRGRSAEKWRLFHAEQVSGIAFGFKARLVALVAIAAWLLLSIPEHELLPLYLFALLLTALSGWIVYLARAKPWVRSAHYLGLVLDVTVLCAVLLVPASGDAGEWALHTWLRRVLFVYLMVYVALNALTYSPVMVLVSGAVALVGLVASYAGVVSIVPGGMETLRRALEPHGVSPAQFFSNQVVVLTIACCLIAAAVWRARRHVLRSVEAERARGNLARYFSPNLVDRLADADRRFEAGQARRAVVLFVDIVGFTRLVEGLPPDRTVALLRAFHKRMVRHVFAHHGTLDKFIGDGLMATFGTPEPRTDDVRRAIACALDMVAAIETWNAERVVRGYPPIDIAIGLHVGVVVLGTIGSPERLEFTVVGDTVNIASRLERLTRAHDAVVLTSGEVIAQAQQAGLPPADLARFVAIGAVTVPGRDGQIDAWALRRTPRANNDARPT
jgi:adenylate cyclase